MNSVDTREPESLESYAFPKLIPELEHRGEGSKGRILQGYGKKIQIFC